MVLARSVYEKDTRTHLQRESEREREREREREILTWMTGGAHCAVMCNLINTPSPTNKI